LNIDDDPNVSTEYMRATTALQREALARKIADLRAAGVPWDGPGGIVDSLRLVSSATQGRALLRKYRLDAEHGGPVEIKPSYDRYAVNPATGQRKGHREPKKRSNGAQRRPLTPTTARPLGPSARPAAGNVHRPQEARDAADDRRLVEEAPDPLVALARRIARETGRQVPEPNSDGPTTRALVLFVLRDPGATETSGANETGVLDPYLNRDPTSTRQQRALGVAGIDPSVCVWWNASPYHLGYKGPIKDADCAAGARYLREFVALCPHLRVVVAMGEPAHAVATRASRGTGARLPTLIRAPHPMIYGRGATDRQARLTATLADVARLIIEPPSR
jgi:hypothetical protein